MANYCPHCMQVIQDDFCPYCGGDIHAASDYPRLPVGTILEVGISRYQIGVTLGKGGFGITYIAVDLRTNQRVAIKEYFPNMCAQRSEDRVTVYPKTNRESIFHGGRHSFLKEAQMLATLEKTPNIVEIYNYFETNGTAYLVMEYLDGVTLKDYVAEHGPISVQTFFPKLPSLIQSIAKIHGQNVIHRDISPDNIMLMPDGSLKLMDFGCARSMEDGKAMTVMYKEGFAPVEQYFSTGQGTWTDVYALCATIYYCITGKVPQLSPDRLDNDRLQPPSALGVAVPPELEEALMWGLTVQPKERPINMEIFARRFCPTPPAKPSPLERILSHLPKNPRTRTILLVAMAAAVIALIVIAVSGG